MSGKTDKKSINLIGGSTRKKMGKKGKRRGSSPRQEQKSRGRGRRG